MPGPGVEQDTQRAPRPPSQPVEAAGGPSATAGHRPGAVGPQAADARHDPMGTRPASDGAGGRDGAATPTPGSHVPPELPVTPKLLVRVTPCPAQAGRHALGAQTRRGAHSRRFQDPLALGHRAVGAEATGPRGLSLAG